MTPSSCCLTYLRFVRGIVDSADLPLNVSREILQESKDIEAIRKGCTAKVLGMLADMAANDKEKYATFWEAFGRVLKEGVGEDFANKEKIAGLLRFASTHDDTTEQTVSLADYIARMKPEQEKIYFVTADTFNAAKNSPHLEVFRKKGIEVLLLSERVDEWVVSHVTEFDGKSLVIGGQGRSGPGQAGRRGRKAGTGIRRRRVQVLDRQNRRFIVRARERSARDVSLDRIPCLSGERRKMICRAIWHACSRRPGKTLASGQTHAGNQSAASGGAAPEG
jgi:hypothetical protein